MDNDTIDLTQKYVELLNSYDPKKGDLSYEVIGVFRAMQFIPKHLRDRQAVKSAVKDVCARFKLGGTNSKGEFDVSNKHADALLKMLDRAELGITGTVG
ncbi:MAG TPA: hypothetical protein VD928_03520 [Candidatus Paceibacterota bacterium]|nr:hypothetical protein [Candidatus Paceibacterota bacterium]